MRSDYLDSLRGANSLAHGTVEQPPKAALALSAHAVALLTARGEEVEIVPSFWRELVALSGEDAGWAVYYLCLMEADLGTIGQIVDNPVKKVMPEVLGNEEVSGAVSGNAALEQLVGRNVRTCLGEHAASGPIQVSETDTTIIRARLKKMGYGGTPAVSDAEVEYISSLIDENGCNDWNQASAWAVHFLSPEKQNQTIADCRESTNIPLGDPVGLYTSFELGMPSGQVEKRASTAELKSWLSSEWATRGQNEESVGNGTVANTILLVELARIRGWNIPDWVVGGVAEASRHPETQGAAMSYLCQVTKAKCDAAVQIDQVGQLEIAPKVLEGSLTDEEGRLLALASIKEEVQEGLCVQREAEVYRAAPQTFATLAAVDETCWQPLSPGVDELSQRIVSAVRDGNLEEARALMLLAETVHGRVAIKEQLVPVVQDAWNSVLEKINEERGEDFLVRSRPLNLVVFAAALKELSS